MKAVSSGEDDPGQESLTELLRFWRRRVRNHRGRGFSQADAARLSGVSERWYRSLESGRPSGFSPDFLDKLAAALELSPAERNALYLKATGRPPALPREPSARASAEMDEQVQAFLDHQAPAPACACDAAWTVVGWNTALSGWFPGLLPQGNLMRWVFLEAAAREQLVRWREDWARPCLAQLRYARAQHPADKALKQLEIDILNGAPEIRELWEEREVYERPDGAIRRLRLPGRQAEEVAVSVVVLLPVRSPSLRVVVFLDNSAQQVSR